MALQEKMGVGKEEDNGVDPGLYMGSGRATKLRRRVTTAPDEPLSPAYVGQVVDRRFPTTLNFGRLSWTQFPS